MEKVSADTRPNPEAFRGLAAYQQTLNQKKTPPAEAASEYEKKQSLTNLFSGKFRKTPEPPSQPPEPVEQPDKEPESKYRRVAKLLILIGPEEASKILAHLEPRHVELVVKEIATIHGVTAEDAASVVIEFRSLLSKSFGYGASSLGGVDTAREILRTAFGKDKGDTILSRAVPETTGKVFSFLEGYSPEQLIMLFKDESPAVEALVLSRLPSALTAKVLADSPPARKFEIIKRIAHMGKTSLDVLDRVAVSLKGKAERLEQNDTIRIDGMSALTDILRASDVSFGDRILSTLESEEPELGQDLKERLHTLEEVIKARDRPIQEKLTTMPDKEIVLLLKNRSKEFTEKILSNVSAQRRVQIREEADIMGPVLKKEADAAARDFLDWFTTQREAGEIILSDDEDILL
ncbi:MAG: flagellar motor switch protein FliG [Spirochaetaceae bacterium]|jgi:flagellar motor switch protein FliG|nr:flagellar motor switch protein FliG [Spirochaetaceae bacterium]